MVCRELSPAGMLTAFRPLCKLLFAVALTANARSLYGCVEQMYAIAAPSIRPYRARRARSPWPGRLARAGVVAAAVLALSLGLARAAEGGAQGAYENLTVQPGDTLWAIASERYPGADVRAKVYEIEQANHLSAEVLYPGEQLRVPTR